jgi:CheY-like chemotaxis protein
MESNERDSMKKALVVDNDFFFVEFLSELLEKRGYTVFKAYDGKEGLEQLAQGPFLVVFVDIIMPKVDGRQFIQITRNKFQNDRCAIAVISGVLIEQLEDLNQIGADYYIAKGPIEKMADHVRAFLDRIEASPGGRQLDLIEPARLYPRQTTSDLVDLLSFHRAIFECVGVGILVVDRDARVIRANPASIRILRKPLESLLNHPVTSVFPGRAKSDIIDAMKHVLRNSDLAEEPVELTMGRHHLRLTFSVFAVSSEISGWIVAVEELPNG